MCYAVCFMLLCIINLFILELYMYILYLNCIIVCDDINIIIINPVLIRFFPRHRKWRNTPHPLRDRSYSFPPSRSSAAYSIFNPTFFTLSSTSLFHVIFGRPRFRCPFTSIIIAFFSILSSSLLITCLYHPYSIRLCHSIQRFLQTQHLRQLLRILSIHQFYSTH